MKRACYSEPNAVEHIAAGSIQPKRKNYLRMKRKFSGFFILALIFVALMAFRPIVRMQKFPFTSILHTLLKKGQSIWFQG